MNPMLKNWHITKRIKDNEIVYYAYGIVYGHKKSKCYDGMLIHTSRIQRIDLSGNNTLEIRTRNTVYHADLDEYGTITDVDNALAGFEYSSSDGDYTENAFGYFNVPPEVFSKITELRKGRCEQRRLYIESFGEKLSDGETYLALSDDEDSYFDFGISKQSGNTEILRKSEHIGTFQDSVLIMSSDCNIVTRYFPLAVKSVEFYENLCSKQNNMAVGTRLGYLKNTGKVALHIRFSWGKVIKLNADEETEVLYKITGIDEP